MMEKEQMYGFEMIHMKDIQDIMKRERCMVVDLRDNDFEEWKNEIPQNVSLILYCEHGNQSMLAARKLRRRRGKIYTVMGGYRRKEKD